MKQSSPIEVMKHQYRTLRKTLAGFIVLPYIKKRVLP